MHRRAHINSKDDNILPTLPSGKKYSPRESSPMPWPVYLHLSRSVFFFSSFTNKQLLRVKSVLKIS